MARPLLLERQIGTFNGSASKHVIEAIHSEVNPANHVRSLQAILGQIPPRICRPLSDEAEPHVRLARIGWLRQIVPPEYLWRGEPTSSAGPRPMGFCN